MSPEMRKIIDIRAKNTINKQVVKWEKIISTCKDEGLKAELKRKIVLLKGNKVISKNHG